MAGITTLTRPSRSSGVWPRRLTGRSARICSCLWRVVHAHRFWAFVSYTRSFASRRHRTQQRRLIRGSRRPRRAWTFSSCLATTVQTLAVYGFCMLLTLVLDLNSLEDLTCIKLLKLFDMEWKPLHLPCGARMFVSCMHHYHIVYTWNIPTLFFVNRQGHKAKPTK